MGLLLMEPGNRRRRATGPAQRFLGTCQRLCAKVFEQNPEASTDLRDAVTPRLVSTIAEASDYIRGRGARDVRCGRRRYYTRRAYSR